MSKEEHHFDSLRNKDLTATIHLITCRPVPCAGREGVILSIQTFGSIMPPVTWPLYHRKIQSSNSIILHNGRIFQPNTVDGDRVRFDSIFRQRCFRYLLLAVRRYGQQTR